MSIKCRILLLLPFSVFYSALFSQTITKQLQLDSLKKQFRKDSAHIYRFKKVRPCFAIDKRSSWIKNENGTSKIPIAVNGLQAGIILYEKHTLGFGIYSIANESKKPVKITDQNNIIRYEELYMHYLTLYYEYSIFDTRFFEMDLPLEIGIGKYNYNLKDSGRTAVIWKEQGPVKVTGGGIQIILKPFKWIGVSGMAGFRIVAFNKKTNLNLNGFYYSYGIWVDLRQIYRDTKFYAFKRPKYRKKMKAILAS